MEANYVQLLIRVSSPLHHELSNLGFHMFLSFVLCFTITYFHFHNTFHIVLLCCKSFYYVALLWWSSLSTWLRRWRVGWVGHSVVSTATMTTTQSCDRDCVLRLRLVYCIALLWFCNTLTFCVTIGPDPWSHKAPEIAVTPNTCHTPWQIPQTD